MSVALAVCFFNDGVKSLVEVLAEMGMPVGDFTSSALTRLDADRQKECREEAGRGDKEEEEEAQEGEERRPG